MLADLVLGGGDEPEADLVADQPGGGADTERQPVEQRIEYAGMTAQLADALLAPGQVVDFFLGRVLHGLAHFGQFGGQGLALVQRLGTDFPGMVDAHQAGHVPGVLVTHLRFRLHDGRRRAIRLAAERQQRAHGHIGLQQQAVDRRVVTLGSHAYLREESRRPVYSNRWGETCAGSAHLRPGRAQGRWKRGRFDQPGGQFIWR